MMIKVQILGDDQPTLVIPEVYQAAVFGKVSHANLGVVYSEGEEPKYPPADAAILGTTEEVAPPPDKPRKGKTPPQLPAN